MLIKSPTSNICLEDNCPVPNISALGGVAVGSMKAELALKVIKKIHGSMSIWDNCIINVDSGNPNEVMAVLLQSSVSKLNNKPNTVSVW